MGEDMRALIRRSIERRGLDATARLLGLRPVPTLRLAAGGDVKHATEELARLNAHRLEDGPSSPEAA